MRCPGKKEKQKVFWIAKTELLEGETHVEKIKKLEDKTYMLFLLNNEVGKVRAVVKLVEEEEEGWKLLDLVWGDEAW